MSKKYFEYLNLDNRPGLLGDIATLIGLYKINILQVSGVSGNWRCFLLEGEDQALEAFFQAAARIPSIQVLAWRKPLFLDYLAVKHGQKIQPVKSEPATYQFTRNDIGVMIDFLGEIIEKQSPILIGLRGKPRVGKTESAIAACVYANKRWTLVSSSLLRQTIRESLGNIDNEHIYLIDGIITYTRGGYKHKELVLELVRNYTCIVEHPDFLVNHGLLTWTDFAYLVELRATPTEEINYEDIALSINAFDLS